MTISAFILVALVSTVSLVSRASDRTAKASQEIEHISRVIASLRRDVAQAEPVRWAGPDTGFVFSGSENEVTFARHRLLSVGARSYVVIRLESDSTGLYRRQTQLFPQSAGFAELALGDRQTLLKGQNGVRFAYFDRLASGQEALVDSWSDPTRMPVAIRVSLRGTAGERSTRIALSVQAEPGCAEADMSGCPLAEAGGSDTESAPEAVDRIDANDPLGWERYTQ